MRHCLAVLEALGVGELRRGLALLGGGPLRGGRGQRGAAWWAASGRTGETAEGFVKKCAR